MENGPPCLQKFNLKYVNFGIYDLNTSGFVIEKTITRPNNFRYQVNLNKNKTKREVF